MSRVLVLGGYGGFGGRISRRLAAAGHEVLAAGRSLERAQRFCASTPGTLPIQADRERGLADLLRQSRPDVLIDAAGPFQGSGYGVVEACIAAGVHYLDIADGRDFVTGVQAFDAAARAAGVVVLSGASSVPALSGAVVRSLAAGCESVRAVEIAISASSQAAAGASVTHAILSYVGRPILLWRGGRWVRSHGWGELRRETFALTVGGPLKHRSVALADVPDLALLPGRLPGRPAVIFRAGVELPAAMILLWAAGRLVRWGWLRGLPRFARALGGMQAVAARFGGDRSGMVVRVFGLRSGRRVERRWTLIAEQGAGPEIPALAAPLLVGVLATGALPSGARDAGEALALKAFDAAFAGLSVRCEEVTVELPPPLYARVLGERFDRLPPSLRALHDVLRDAAAEGRATVRRGRNPLARAAAALFRFPAAGEHDLHVHLEEREGVETWTRSFSGRPFRSRLSQRRGRLSERFGPFAFDFDLDADGAGLAMRLRGWRMGFLPLPMGLAPRSDAREWEEEGRFHFDVPISLPIVGLVVHYSGWLLPTPP